jgi:hypothetical protein
MSAHPSRALKSALTNVLGEKEGMAALFQAKETSAPIAMWVESPAGAVIMDALDDVERAAMSRLIDVPAIFIFKAMRDKVEISIVRYIRMRLMSHVQNHTLLQREIARIRGVSEEDIE